jgi:long-chain fatty acid transport protein
MAKIANYRILIRITCVLWLLVIGPLPSMAGGFSNLSFGSRRMGMFAVVARPDDGSSIYHNPAGMVLMDGTHLYTNQSVIVSEVALRFYDSQGQLHPDHNVVPDWSIGVAPMFSAITDFGTEDLRFGLSLYVPNAFGAMLPDDEATRYHITETLFMAGKLNAAVAWNVDDRFAVGVGFSAIYVYLTAQRYINPVVLQDPDERFKTKAETADMDYLLDLNGQDITWAVDFGMLFRPTDTLNIGLTFSGGSEVLLGGDVILTHPDKAITMSSHTTSLALPFTLKAGVNWEFTKDFEIGFDTVYWHYQVYQEQRSDLTTPILGMSELVSPKNYENASNWSMGLLHHLTPTWELMIGYQRDFTAIPDSSFSLEIPTRNNHGISTGARW